MDNDINPPNIFLWGFLPGIIVFVLCAFCFSSFASGGSYFVSQTKEDETPEGQSKWLIFGASLLIFCCLCMCVPFGVGSSMYQLGLTVKNPKLGASLAATHMLSKASRSYLGEHGPGISIRF